MDSVASMRIFARVVESGSFSAAGRQLGLAPSSVSRQIGEVEEDLAARLFHRTTRKLSLNEAGKVYYDWVRQILDVVDEARLAVTQFDGAPSGVHARDRQHGFRSERYVPSNRTSLILLIEQPRL